jgi:hypothetical protein
VASPCRYPIPCHPILSHERSRERTTQTGEALPPRCEPDSPCEARAGARFQTLVVPLERGQLPRPRRGTVAGITE